MWCFFLPASGHSLSVPTGNQILAACVSCRRSSRVVNPLMEPIMVIGIVALPKVAQHLEFEILLVESPLM